MAMPVSTRSQLPSTGPTSKAPSPPPELHSAGGTFSKAGRRVLAELPSNDSPVAACPPLPAGTPVSSRKDAPPRHDALRRREAPTNDAVPSRLVCPTPLGEFVLRSQLLDLWQKIECDVGANQPAKAPPPYLGNVMRVSPTMLAAPTPLNTPQMPASISQRESSQDGMDLHRENAELLISSTVSGDQPASNKIDAESLGIHRLRDSVSRAASTTLQAPLSFEASDAPNLAGINAEKGPQNFEHDTGCKVSSEEESLARMDVEVAGHCSPSIRQLEEDELSQWSVNVNVGSPVDKESFIDLSEATSVGPGLSPGIEDLLMFRDHVKMLQQVSSSKVKLLWDKDKERKALKGDRNDEGGITEPDYEENDEDYSEYVDECSYSEQHDDCYDGEECANLCDMFTGMSFEKLGRPLPKGEGKHIRFVYEDDEIVDAVLVNGEEETLQSSPTIVADDFPKNQVVNGHEEVLQSSSTMILDGFPQMQVSQVVDEEDEALQSSSPITLGGSPKTQVVNGEVEALQSSMAIILKGLPKPSGRHWHFDQDDDE